MSSRSFRKSSRRRPRPRKRRFPSPRLRRPATWRWEWVHVDVCTRTVTLVSPRATGQQFANVLRSMNVSALPAGEYSVHIPSKGDWEKILNVVPGGSRLQRGVDCKLAAPPPSLPAPSSSVSSLLPLAYASSSHVPSSTHAPPLPSSTHAPPLPSSTHTPPPPSSTRDVLSFVSLLSKELNIMRAALETT